MKPAPFDYQAPAPFAKQSTCSSAFCVPATAKSPSPAASNKSTGLRSRSMAKGHPKGDDSGEQRNRQIAPVVNRRRRHRADQQVASDAPGIARRIRQTRTPNRSSRCLTPAVAPLSAKTKVPMRSSSNRSVSIVGSPTPNRANRRFAIPDRPGTRCVRARARGHLRRKPTQDRPCARRQVLDDDRRQTLQRLVEQQDLRPVDQRRAIASICCSLAGQTL